MRIFTPIIFASILYLFSNSIFAANESTQIDLQLTHIEYVNLIGNVVGASKYFSVDDIEPAGNSGPGPTVSLGQLGLEGNTVGSCTLDFSTINNFRLRHTVTNRRLTRYRLNYKNKKINKKNTSMTLISCNEAQSSLDFTAVGNFRRNVKSGIYQDIVTITVTTQ